jgi:hypothetical protein
MMSFRLNHSGRSSGREDVEGNVHDSAFLQRSRPADIPSGKLVTGARSGLDGPRSTAVADEMSAEVSAGICGDSAGAGIGTV